MGMGDVLAPRAGGWCAVVQLCEVGVEFRWKVQQDSTHLDMSAISMLSVCG